MVAQRRIALISVATACTLIAVKLVAGLVSGSLGLVSEAAHSGTDLVAALLTFFALGVAVRPADRSHPYGHAKAEHLAALAEASLLVVASLFIVWRAVDRLAGGAPAGVRAEWWTFAVVGVVIALDASRASVLFRAASRYGSAALQASALHFASDLAGSLAVLTGLVFARAGFAEADSASALFVAALVLIAAGRLISSNVGVLMDRTPADAHAAARRAIQRITPPVELRRLRLRQAAGRHFADVVIGVSPGAAVGQAHTVADAVEQAVERALPGADVVVHVEPKRSSQAALRERALEAALQVPRVREIHNVSVVRVGDRTEVSLHLKLPGGTSLADAHALASQVEAAIMAALPEVDAVQTHLEPLAETSTARDAGLAEARAATDALRDIVSAVPGVEIEDLRFLHTDAGLVTHVTLTVDEGSTLADAHARASEIEDRIRSARPGIADVIVHTEPRKRATEGSSPGT
jgi:cation diffusion facilitator family transporter